MVGIHGSFAPGASPDPFGGQYPRPWPGQAPLNPALGAPTLILLPAGTGVLPDPPPLCTSHCQRPLRPGPRSPPAPGRGREMLGAAPPPRAGASALPGRRLGCHGDRLPRAAPSITQAAAPPGPGGAPRGPGLHPAGPGNFLPALAAALLTFPSSGPLCRARPAQPRHWTLCLQPGQPEWPPDPPLWAGSQSLALPRSASWQSGGSPQRSLFLPVLSARV